MKCYTLSKYNYTKWVCKQIIEDLRVTRSRGCGGIFQKTLNGTQKEGPIALVDSFKQCVSNSRTINISLYTHIEK